MTRPLASAPLRTFWEGAHQPLASAPSARIAQDGPKRTTPERTSVGTAQLKNNAVKTKKIAAQAVTAAKLARSEPYHEVGAAGKPAFQNGWANAGPVPFSTAAFYKDPLGVVHLKGDLLKDPGAVVPAFRLPPGYARLRICSCRREAVSGAAHLFIEPDGDVTPECVVGDHCDVGMDGLTFRVP